MFLTNRLVSSKFDVFLRCLKGTSWKKLSSSEHIVYKITENLREFHLSLPNTGTYNLELFTRYDLGCYQKLIVLPEKRIPKKM